MFAVMSFSDVWSVYGVGLPARGTETVTYEACEHLVGCNVANRRDVGLRNKAWYSFKYRLGAEHNLCDPSACITAARA
jgi:hypothetical protein